MTAAEWERYSNTASGARQMRAPVVTASDPLDPHWCEDCQGDHGIELATTARLRAEVDRLAEALTAERALWAKDGDDGHRCVRVEAYAALRAELTAERARVQRMEAAAQAWLNGGPSSDLFAALAGDTEGGQSCTGATP